jgi:5-methylcytosine-specific restriction endonuclease McrA
MDLLSKGKRKRFRRRKNKSLGPAFYKTKEWQEIRFKTLLRYGRKCMCCFATNIELHVDHIKPISKYPELVAELENMQVLCRDCNLGKLDKYEVDFRTEDAFEKTNPCNKMPNGSPKKAVT